MDSKIFVSFIASSAKFVLDFVLWSFVFVSSFVLRIFLSLFFLCFLWLDSFFWQSLKLLLFTTVTLTIIRNPEGSARNEVGINRPNERARVFVWFAVAICID